MADFLYDFGSPNAYLAHRVLGDIESRTGERFRYLPCLLGGIFKATGNRAPFLVYQDVPAKLRYGRLEMQRFVERHGLQQFRMNPHFPVNTLLLMRAACAAEIDSQHHAFVEAGMRAMWERELKMDDPAVFVSALEAAGLDGERLLARAGEDDAKQRLLDNTAAAVARGVFGIPSFFVGEELYFGKDRLEQVEEQIRRAAG